MLRPLKALDYIPVKRLFQTTFGVSEDKNFIASWRYRDKDASFGLWDNGALLGVTIVRGTCLEYIFLDTSCRGLGLGTTHLKAVLERIPAIHLTPVNDPRVIRWYESQGFRRLCNKLELNLFPNGQEEGFSRVRHDSADGQSIYLHHAYNLRSHSTLMEAERREKPVSAK